MPVRCYKKKRLGADKLAIIKSANEIIASYQAQGYKLTLRQAYYRFIALDLFPESWIDPVAGTKNNMKSYKKLGDIIGDGRMAGLIDWEGIEDRTRELAGISHWETPGDIIKTCVGAYHLDRWNNQPYRVEAWIEKDALEGIVKQAAHGYDCAAFSCRGYSSMSSVWEASQRLMKYIEAKQRPVILYAGDHDPSGLDVPRYIADSLNQFVTLDWLHDHMDVQKASWGEVWNDISQYITGDKPTEQAARPVTVKRIALTREQIDEYNPPPNPAKTTDSRYKKYEEEHGTESWELDALEPSVLTELIQTEIAQLLDRDAYDDRVSLEKQNRTRLAKTSSHWNNGLSAYVDKLKEKKS